MEMGKRLRKVRKSKGYTQEALAAAIGVSRGVITNIEYGKSEPQPLAIHAICDVLGINEHWFISGEGQVERNPDLEKSSHLLSDIYNLAKELSEEEQDYILDMIVTFQKHRERIMNIEGDTPAERNKKRIEKATAKYLKEKQERQNIL